MAGAASSILPADCWVGGNPIGATGLAQSVELVQQLRGTAGARQVEGARVALQHNQGIGGACVVTLYQA
jgi:acetyl-CoA acetyltransferase